GALASGLPAACPSLLDPAALTDEAARGTLQPVFRGLVRTPARRARAADIAAPAGLGERLAPMDADARREALLSLVLDTVAGVLGHADPLGIDPDRGLLDLGFDSLTAVELRNTLQKATGLRLPVTLLFDHPSSTAVAEHLGSHFAPADGAADGAADRVDDAAAALDELSDADDDELFAFIDRELER
ncbi:MAG: hypothetical protein QG622_2387, partial [Actinomycetota bacterium]|nr:hypothetical protein [Actinomycetota bacterium]